MTNFGSEKSFQGTGFEIFPFLGNNPISGARFNRLLRLFVFTMTEVGNKENVDQSIAEIYQSTTTAPVNIAVTLPPPSKVQS